MVVRQILNWVTKEKWAKLEYAVKKKSNAQKTNAEKQGPNTRSSSYPQLAGAVTMETPSP
jgi:hypothetical protein